MLKKLSWLLIVFGLFLGLILPSSVLAQNDSQPPEQEVVMYVFWGEGCPRCAAQKPFLDQLARKYPQLRIEDFEVYRNQNNQRLFSRIAEAYGTTPLGVPMIFVGQDFVVGFGSEETSGKQIEDLVRNCLTNGCPSPEQVLAQSGLSKPESPSLPTDQPSAQPQTEEDFAINFFGRPINLRSGYPLYALGIILGLVDGVNPCMFSVLLFLLTYLLAVGSRKKALKVGLAFVFGVFVIYFLFMIGMINLIGLIGFIQQIKTVVAILALVVGVIMVKDFFFYGRWLSLEIPSRAKPTVERLIKKGTVPSALLLALLSSLVEIPCTSGIPLVYVTLLAQKGGAYLPYLIWYNIFFVLPLLTIIAVVIFAWAKVDKIEKWRLNFRKYMRLVAGLILVFLGVALLRGWL